jgi:subtilisin family serine protease
MPDSTVKIVPQLVRRIERDPEALHRVAIVVSTQKVPLGAAFTQVDVLVKQVLDDPDRTEQHVLSLGDDMHPYVVARLQGKVIRSLADLDDRAPEPPGPVISVIRPDVDDGQYFNPDNMVRSVISVPMLRQMEADEKTAQSVMIEVNTNYSQGRSAAKEHIAERIQQAIAEAKGLPEEQFIAEWKTKTSDQYVYATLTGETIRRLVDLDQQPGLGTNGEPHAIYHIWPDFKLRAQIWHSVATVKADACRRSFATTGRGIVWAVFDSGIDGTHPHFKKHSNLDLPGGLTHFDFTGANPVPLTVASLTDEYGHGTHVAGIIAGELDDKKFQAKSLLRQRDENGRISYTDAIVTVPIMGVAPECTLLSYRVLDKRGEGSVSTVIAAIQKVQELNGYGRNIIVHGVNMSLGYDFDPEWFACGQSPVCVEVDRLVRSGVAVVIAAGNTGRGFALTINDPGNAELAVTVGATHRDMPHRYGVSYFSSKGPTGDGRQKPDLLAPGERIMSCGAGPDLITWKQKANVPLAGEGTNVAYYLERSGTSMAAPHVSGIIAGILSTRGEFVGLPEDIKGFLVSNAMDLGRDRNFQGGGLVDMMRAIQAF